MREEAEKIPPVKARIDATYNFRLNESKDGASLAERPHQFREHYIINDNSKIKSLSRLFHLSAANIFPSDM